MPRTAPERRSNGGTRPAVSPNLLYYGDNLDVLRRHIKDETVDLVYLDPPFKSDRDYNVLFAEQSGSRAAAQIKAFEDSWQWDQESAKAYEEVVERGGKVSRAMQAFRMLLGESDMMAYLAMMAPRLVELHRVLKPSGSIYLHCDPTASHYLKLLLDSVFGTNNFLNEIIWSYKAGAVGKATFGKKHDTILRYGKSSTVVFYPNQVRIPYADSTLQRLKYAGAREKNVQKVLERGGKVPTDVWEIGIIQGNSPERLGYPTQKPEELLERIIHASSREGDVVLDPFCGCGTAVAVAQRLKRRWVGIDITHLAIALIRHRLQDAFGSSLMGTYRVIGEPVSLPDAETLAMQDPYQFQWWALGRVDARPVEEKKGADRGIDGRLYFHDEPTKTKQIIFSVKAGHTGVAHVRDLRGVLVREKAQIGVLITLQEPTKAMRVEAASAGFYESPISWGSKGKRSRYPHLQILTIAELLAGKRVEYPPSNITFKRAPRATPEEPGAMSLPLGEEANE